MERMGAGGGHHHHYPFFFVHNHHPSTPSPTRYSSRHTMASPLSSVICRHRVRQKIFGQCALARRGAHTPTPVHRERPQSVGLSMPCEVFRRTAVHTCPAEVRDLVCLADSQYTCGLHLWTDRRSLYCDATVVHVLLGARFYRILDRFIDQAGTARARVVIP